MAGNPILQMLGGAGNPLQQALSILQSNPQQMLNNMLNSNPQFQQFVNENKDLTGEQICQKFGVDPAILKFIQ